jgi:hypothetical protein
MVVFKKSGGRILMSTVEPQVMQVLRRLAKAIDPDEFDKIEQPDAALLVAWVDQDLYGAVTDLGEILKALAGEHICASCKKPAACIGSYEGSVWAFACDSCCAHGNEDGCCFHVAEAELAEVLTAEGLAAHHELDEELQRADDELEKAGFTRGATTPALAIKTLCRARGLAEQREMEARRTAEEFRNESNDNAATAERNRQARETLRRERDEARADLEAARAKAERAREILRVYGELVADPALSADDAAMGLRDAIKRAQESLRHFKRCPYAGFRGGAYYCDRNCAVCGGTGAVQEKPREPKQTAVKPEEKQWCECSDRMSGGVPCAPGTCPNVKKTEKVEVQHDPGHPHLVNGEFQSDKYPTTPRGKVPLSVKDTTAQHLLWEYAQIRRSVDAEFANDLEEALKRVGYQDYMASGAFGFCKGCGRRLLLGNLFVDDGCPCNTRRGVNFEPQRCGFCKTDNCVKPGHRIAALFGV